MIVLVDQVYYICKSYFLSHESHDRTCDILPQKFIYIYIYIYYGDVDVVSDNNRQWWLQELFFGAFIAKLKYNITIFFF